MENHAVTYFGISGSASILKTLDATQGKTDGIGIMPVRCVSATTKKCFNTIMLTGGLNDPVGLSVNGYTSDRIEKKSLPKILCCSRNVKRQSSPI